MLIQMKNLNFKKSLSLSSGLHISLLLFALVFALIQKFLGTNQAGDETINKLSSAMRVDVVAMPEMTLKELRSAVQAKGAPVSAPVEKQAPIKEGETVLKKVKKQADLMNFLSDMSQKKVGRKKTKTKKKKGTATGAPNSFHNDELIRLGNQITKGTTLGQGEQGGEVDGVFAQYLGGLPDKIRPFWRVPSYLMNKGHQCRIRVFIAKNGKILDREIYQSSGVKEFDNRALRALDQVGAFPAPSSEIVARVVSGKVIIGFPL